MGTSSHSNSKSISGNSPHAFRFISGKNRGRAYLDRIVEVRLVAVPQIPRRGEKEEQFVRHRVLVCVRS